MDFLQDQFKSVESIVSDTQTEHSRFEGRKLEVQELKKKLFLFNISKVLKDKQFEISYVEVKAYRSRQEVEEISSDILLKYPASSTFLVVDIIIPKFLHSFLVNSGLVVNIRICYNNIITSQTFPFSESTAIKEVLPVYDCSYNCKVDIIFFGKINGKNIILKIKTINIDISYYLMSSKIESNSRHFSIQEKLMHVCTLYTDNFNRHYFKDYLLKYQIFSSFSQKEFIEVVLKNCYVHLNLNNLLNGEESKLHIRNEDLKIFITYDLEQKILILKSRPCFLYRVKKYFLNELDLNVRAEKLKFSKLSEFQVCTYGNFSEAYKALRSIYFLGDR
ncbi:hypothetical protein WA026_012844 [Henosepilachna vigintioctopunctata]|uniref:RNA polymerase alpha subunit n=1 Tax=Henosepilachna vigintioctopunctata TaxID=420089 RepID=A0AAW1TS23_9CUCU